MILKAEARDFGVGSLPAYTQIDVRVVDLNDNAPEISVSFLNSLARNTSLDSSSSLVYLNENTEPGRFIAHVSISDLDSPGTPHSHIVWNVLVNNKSLNEQPQEENSPGNHLSLTKLNDNSFTLLTGDELDRESTPAINVSIVACNPAPPGMVNSQSVCSYFNFTLVLVDENDNEPRFDRDLYELELTENNFVGQMIHKFVATDSDADSNGHVTYSLDGGADLFRIDAETGVLRAAHVFDREHTSVYEFDVLARDNPAGQNESSSRNTRARVRLSILDLNDNKPVIVYNATLPHDLLNSSDLLVRIDESAAPITTEIGRFECHDVDVVNSRTRMFLLSSYDLALARANGGVLPVGSSSPDSPFVLEPSTGRLRVNKRLDRETQDAYEYVLVCTDSIHNSTLRVHIRLNDVNDNCPRALNKSDTANSNKSPLKTVFVNRDSDVYRWPVPLFTEYYTDDDAGKNARLTFALDSHIHEFEVNTTESTDQVYGVKLGLNRRLIAAPDGLSAVKLGKYVVKLIISDQGNPSCIKTDKFVVYIGDNTTQNQVDLIARMAKSSDEYVNDELGEMSSFEEDKDASEEIRDELDDDVKSRLTMGGLSMRSRLSGAFNSLRRTDYFILVTLVATLIVIGSILSLVGLVFFCRRDRDSSAYKKKKSASKIRGLEVKNFRGAHPGSAGPTTLSVLNGDDDTPSEMNNLLLASSAGSSSPSATDDVDSADSNNTPTSNVNQNGNNRLSLSIKSTDQSQSADSVASNITFARDTTSSSASSSSSSGHHHHHHHHHGANVVDENTQHEMMMMMMNAHKPAYSNKVTFGSVRDDFQSKVIFIKWHSREKH